MRDKDIFIALNRFGLGMSEGDIALAKDAPREWVKAQISPKYLKPKSLTDMPGAAQLLGQYYEMRKDTKAGDPRRRAATKMRKDSMIAALETRALHKVTTPAPVVERFTQFWSNHFTVSRTRGQIGQAIPAYETEAIRPYIFSKFEDLLLAAVTHPCMLLYLDNVSSVGPNSKRGRRRDKDLNENLAREVLELHTMGAGGGYTQNDIIEFAKVLSGWTVQKVRGERGGTHFAVSSHEPGKKTILGKTYKGDGARELIAVLRDLAVHPSTATFIAKKLAKHFISDTPAQADIDVLAKAYQRSGGDLAKVSQALVDLDSVWTDPLPKLKTPEDLVFAVLRADPSKIRPKRKLRKARVAQALKTMGQDMFNAPSPAGWPEETDRWLSPESLVHRIEWVRDYASKMDPTVNPDDLFDVTIAPAADRESVKMIKGAPSREDAIAMIFASAAFQRR